MMKPLSPGDERACLFPSPIRSPLFLAIRNRSPNKYGTISDCELSMESAMDKEIIHFESTMSSMTHKQSYWYKLAVTLITFSSAFSAAIVLSILFANSSNDSAPLSSKSHTLSQRGIYSPPRQASSSTSTSTSASAVESTSFPTSSSDLDYSPSSESGSEYVLSVTASNEYGDVKSNMFSYPFLDNSLLIEPYKTTTFILSLTAATTAEDTSTLSSSIPSITPATRRKMTDSYSESETETETETETDIDSVDVTSDCTYQWFLVAVNSTLASYEQSGWTSSGTFTATLTTPGQYTLQIYLLNCEQLGIDPETVALAETVWVKYVRREVTSLTDTDREEFLDALHTLWTTDTVTGMELYGEAYRSVQYLSVVYSDGTANPVCDEFRGGPGFLSNHILLSAHLEQSLQLVNPATALHYIDYPKYFSDLTYNSHISNQLDGGVWTELMTYKYFGSSDPVSGEILDGRWNHSTTYSMTPSFFASHVIDANATFFPSEESLWTSLSVSPHISSPLGLLRSPWNLNPTDTLTRYNNQDVIPSLDGIDDSVTEPITGVTCDDYSSFVTTRVLKQPLSVFLQYVEEELYVQTLNGIGGVGGTQARSNNQYLKSSFNFTDEDLLVVTQAAHDFFKSVLTLSPLQRENSFETLNGFPFPLNCSYSTATDDYYSSSSSTTEYSCVCSSAVLESEETMNLFTKFYFKEFTPDEEVQYEVVENILALPFRDKTVVLQSLCSHTSWDGDLSSSTAALDPMFWVSTGSMERLFQRVLFEKVVTDTSFDDSETTQCSGHTSSGTKRWLSEFQLPPRWFSSTSSTTSSSSSLLGVAASDLTNDEWLQILDPTGDLHREAFDYVYDSSSYTWCIGEDAWFP